VAAVEGVADTAMDMAEQGSTTLHHIQADTAMMVATVQAAVPRREGVVEAEVTKFRLSLRDLIFHVYLLA
jgi:hypothetical protein